MTHEPSRWKDSADVDALTRQLLGAGRKTTSLPSTARMRGERRLARVAAAPVVALGVGLWSKVVAAAFGAGFASALAVVTVSPTLREKLWLGAAQPAALSPPSSQPASRSLPSSARAAALPSVPADVTRASAATEPLPREGVASPAARPSNATSRIAGSNASSPRPSIRDEGELRASPPDITEPAPALSGLAVMPPVPPAPAVTAAGDGLSAEVQLLSQARALVNSDPNGALDLLNRHARLFPGAALAMEREVLVIEALARSGRAGDASARAKELLAASPGALYTARLERILARSGR